MAHQRKSAVQTTTTLIEETKENGLAAHYGGNTSGSWVDSLPSSWVPYVQLARLSPPAGLFLTFFPHLFGALHAAIVQGSSRDELLRGLGLLFGGTFFFSNALHVWNDIVDEPVDKLIPRTQGRPIVRGAVTKRAAFIFTVSQALGACIFLLGLPAETAFWAFTNFPLTAYYPYAKRHTHFPQVVLGIWLGWGVLVGDAAMGLKPGHDVSSWCLVAACLFWTIISDTTYAYQDREEDIRVGAYSMAVLFGKQTKPMLWVSLVAMLLSLAKAGEVMGLGLPFYVLTVGGCATALGSMIGTVDLDDKVSCWWWFRYGFWMVGIATSAGLFATYVLS